MSAIQPHTHQLKTIQRIDELLELQQFALEHIQEAVFFVNIDARFTYVNQAASTYFGYSKEELLAMNVFDLDPHLSAETWREHWLEIQKNKSVMIETEHRTKDGTLVLVEVNANYFDYNGVGYNMALIRDITEKKNEEKIAQRNTEQLQEATTKLSTLFSSIPDMIWMKDPEGKYLSCNSAYETFIGVKEDQLIGKTDYDFYSSASADVCKQSDIDAMHAGEVCISEESINYRDNSIGIMEIRKAPIYNPSGEMIGVLGIGRDISERKLFEKQIEFMAHHDALTGLPNRALAQDRMEQAIVYAKRHNTQAALIFIDLDGFKIINDTLGHSIGDAILQKVAKRLHLCVRESDTISRQGGDEFLLILPEINDPEDVRAIADKLIQTFEKPFTVHNQLLSVSASIGIAIYPYHGDDFNNLLKNSDVAMYKAKESGKNTYCFYTKKMNRDIIDQFKIESDLKSALQNNEFILHYQPQIDLATNTIAGVEALIRWNHPQHGMIPPLSFIPIAEGSGQIVQIGQWVIEEACRQAALWHSLGITVRVAVNISATQFKRGNLETVVKDALKLSGLNPKFFELELTESTMMHNLESTLQMVQSLKALGVQLSIDDFGTGYSSLAYLKRFAVDTLKIDQSFVRDIVQDQEDTVIVNTIIQMAKSLNLKTIAEGVENLDVLAILEDFGCNEVQGYHYAKPMEASEFERYFTSQLHTK
jgi:diguanylate cyclase (GGDEF)-like protein/PAS domain S-box-containing protein